MKKIIILLLFINSIPSFIIAQTTSFDSDRLKKIQEWITSDIAHKKMQGAVIMIADKNNLVYSFVNGKSNIETNRSLKIDDYFKIASMTKVVTSIGVLQLYEKGLFDLDDPISKYIPQLKNTQMLTNDANSSEYLDTKTPVTIRQLLNHTAGYAYGGKKVSKIYKENQINFFNPKESNLKEFIDKMGSVPLVHQPGKQFSYGPSTDILGYLIEKLSNTSLETYLKKYIFNPLKMNTTGFNVYQENPDKLVDIYIMKDDALTLSKNAIGFDKRKINTVFMGGSGLVSTASDYLKFTQMLLNNGEYNGKKIVSRKSIELLSTDQLKDIHYPKGFEPILGKNNTFGLGVNIITKSGASNEFYSEGAYYWEGAYSTTFIVDPKEQFTAVFMT
ncbi:serine hydrolase domain-containing protein [Aquimarina algiphila]|uniref:serine hydrolase domain-containing protein n=1 Tax=Aquimarina algiphila TaxID=2047982 RepID=UPI00232FDDD9|nr:serine hydrolase domain-containing protein [Aquimarina algiphila]